MKKTIAGLFKETKKKFRNIIKYLKNKNNALNIIIGGFIILILVLLLLSTIITPGLLAKTMKVLIVALYGGLVFIVIWRKDIMPKRRKGRKINDKGTKKINRSKVVTKAKSKPKKKLKKVISIIGIIILATGILGLIAVSLFLGYVVTSAPSFDPANLYRKEASIIYDQKGKILTKIGREIRDKISYDDIPEIFIDAIIATEDARYFQHNGFDAPRFIKASLGQLSGQYAGGASTITMQVVKNNFTSTEQSIMRKFTDIYLAIFKLEKKYTKEEILEFYVNAPYLGNNSYGISEASRNYFGKEVKDLNLTEAALLAGIFQAPGAYDPYIYPENAERRRTTVLYLMKRHGYISAEEEKIANAIPVEDLLKSKSAVTMKKYQGYLDTVIDEAEKKTGYSPYNVPMKIYTGYSEEKQSYVDKVLTGELFKFPNDFLQVGLAVTDINTGVVVAIGNGRNRSGERLYNFATMSKRQIGSTSKPIFEYAVGMETDNWSTYTPFVDDAHTYSNGRGIKNWDSKYFGFQTMRMALAQSRNIPALKAFQQLNNKDILNFVLSLGITPEIEDGRIHEAHAIGAFNGASPLQMAAAYAAFGNGGYYIEPYTITKIEYMDSKEVNIFKPIKTQVMSDSTAFMITDILRYGVDNRLIGGGRVPGIQVAAKSGTTNFGVEIKKAFQLPDAAINDLWYIGYSPDYAIGMWIGYEKISNKYYNTSSTGWSIRDRLFTTFAQGIFEKNNKTFETPKSVVRIEVERESVPAMLPSAHTPQNMRVYEYFKKGTEPTEVSPRYSALSNPTNVDINNVDSDVKLTWNHVPAPNSVTDELIKVLGNHKDKYLAKRIADDLAILGEIGYNVYLKQGSELLLLGWTNNNSFTHRPLNAGNLTYVIKTCYAKYKDNKSSGSEITLSSNPYIPLIEVNLVGSSTVNVPAGTSYTENGVLVLDNSVNVTANATVTKTITKDGQSVPNNQINTSVLGTYIIKYEVTYQGQLYTLTRTVIVG